jgi:hypothetical protein
MHTGNIGPWVNQQAPTLVPWLKLDSASYPGGSGYLNQNWIEGLGHVREFNSDLFKKNILKYVLNLQIRFGTNPNFSHLFIYLFLIFLQIFNFLNLRVHGGQVQHQSELAMYPL